MGGGGLTSREEIKKINFQLPACVTHSNVKILLVGAGHQRDDVGNTELWINLNLHCVSTD